MEIFNSIESLLQIKLESHEARIGNSMLRRMNKLLENNEVINRISTLNEAGLKGPYHVWENNVNTVGNFIDHIAKSNGLGTKVGRVLLTKAISLGSSLTFRIN